MLFNTWVPGCLCQDEQHSWEVPASGAWDSKRSWKRKTSLIPFSSWAGPVFFSLFGPWNCGHVGMRQVWPEQRSPRDTQGCCSRGSSQMGWLGSVFSKVNSWARWWGFLLRTLPSERESDHFQVHHCPLNKLGAGCQIHFILEDETEQIGVSSRVGNT